MQQVNEVEYDEDNTKTKALVVAALEVKNSAPLCNKPLAFLQEWISIRRKG